MESRVATKFRAAALLALFAAIGAGPARAAVVLMKDGGRLEGDIISSTASGIVLKIEGEELVIDAEKIRSIDYTRTAPPQRPVPAPRSAPPSEDVRPRRERRAELFDDETDTLSLDFGLAAPLSRVSFSAIGGGTANNGDVGPAFGLQYLHKISPRAGLGLEFHWYDRSAADSQDLLASSDARVYGDTLLLMGVVKFELVDRGWTRPYVLLGAGAHRTSLQIDARPDQGFVWGDTGTDERRLLVDDAEWGGAFSARLGLDFGPPNPWVFSLEAGWTGLSSSNYRATGAGQALGLAGVSGPLNYFTFAARWGWSL